MRAEDDQLGMLLRRVLDDAAGDVPLGYLMGMAVHVDAGIPQLQR